MTRLPNKVVFKCPDASFHKVVFAALSLFIILAKENFLDFVMKSANQGTFEQRPRKVLLLMFYDTYLKEHKGTWEISCQDGIEIHYYLRMRIYRKFFINWIPANLIPCYKRAFTLWMCISSKLYGAKYIAFICLVGPDLAFENRT